MWLWNRYAEHNVLRIFILFFRKLFEFLNLSKVELSGIHSERSHLKGLKLETKDARQIWIPMAPYLQFTLFYVKLFICLCTQLISCFLNIRKYLRNCLIAIYHFFQNCSFSFALKVQHIVINFFSKFYVRQSEILHPSTQIKKRKITKTAWHIISNIREYYYLYCLKVKESKELMCHDCALLEENDDHEVTFFASQSDESIYNTSDEDMDPSLMNNFFIYPGENTEVLSNENSENVISNPILNPEASDELNQNDKRENIRTLESEISIAKSSSRYDPESPEMAFVHFILKVQNETYLTYPVEESTIPFYTEKPHSDSPALESSPQNTSILEESANKSETLLVRDNSRNPQNPVKDGDCISEADICNKKDKNSENKIEVLSPHFDVPENVVETETCEPSSENTALNLDAEICILSDINEFENKLDKEDLPELKNLNYDSKRKFEEAKDDFRRKFKKVVEKNVSVPETYFADISPNGKLAKTSAEKDIFKIPFAAKLKSRPGIIHSSTKEVYNDSYKVIDLSHKPCKSNKRKSFSKNMAKVEKEDALPGDLNRSMFDSFTLQEDISMFDNVTDTSRNIYCQVDCSYDRTSDRDMPDYNSKEENVSSIGKNNCYLVDMSEKFIPISLNLFPLEDHVMDSSKVQSIGLTTSAFADVKLGVQDSDEPFMSNNNDIIYQESQKNFERFWDRVHNSVGVEETGSCLENVKNHTNKEENSDEIVKPGCKPLEKMYKSFLEGGDPSNLQCMSTQSPPKRDPSYKPYPGLASDPTRVKKDARYQKKFYRLKKDIPEFNPSDEVNEKVTSKSNTHKVSNNFLSQPKLNDIECSVLNATFNPKIDNPRKSVICSTYDWVESTSLDVQRLSRVGEIDFSDNACSLPLPGEADRKQFNSQIGNDSSPSSSSSYLRNKRKISKSKCFEEILDSGPSLFANYDPTDMDTGTDFKQSENVSELATVGFFYGLPHELENNERCSIIYSRDNLVSPTEADSRISLLPMLTVQYIDDHIESEESVEEFLISLSGLKQIFDEFRFFEVPLLYTFKSTIRLQNLPIKKKQSDDDDFQVMGEVSSTTQRQSNRNSFHASPNPRNSRNI